jgi:lysozyme
MSELPPAGIAGLDCYHGDGAVDFAQAKSCGVVFAYVKASEGIHSADPLHADNRARCKDAGMLFGSYHFFDPLADPLEQARFFIGRAAPVAGELIPALDVEVSSDSVGHDALACAYEIKWLCGRFPVLYAGQDFYLEHLHTVFPEATTLWIARYGAEPSVSCAFWQWSQAWREPGMDHPLDGDVFRGAREELNALIIA